MSDTVQKRRFIHGGTLFLAMFVGASMAAATAAEPLPRYRLQVGQELTYRGNDEFKYERGRFVTRENWKVWVVRENPDQSWRLLIRYGSVFSQIRDQKKTGDASREPARRADVNPPDEQPEEVAFAYCDLHSDGRLTPNDSFGYQMRPAKIFPRLPLNAAEADQGWKSHDTRMDETALSRLAPASAIGRIAIEVTRESAMNAIYGEEYHDAVTIDRERGIPEKIVSENRQTYGFKGQGAGTLELIAVQNRPANWTRQLTEDAERYFTVQAAYDKAARRRDLSPEELKTALQGATADLQRVCDAIETPELKKLLADQLPRREQTLKYTLEEAAGRAALLGTPSEDWTTTDLTGESHSLQDYRGKVVILDFWYRGCGWCIRAMPQVMEVATRFEGQPVVVLGMNTDRKEEDALFVVEKMGLKYVNLKATGLPEKYKVNGFPTLLILDQQGVIRDIHVGYSPTLRDDVVLSVERLLMPKP